MTINIQHYKSIFHVRQKTADTIDARYVAEDEGDLYTVLSDDLRRI